MSRSLPVHEGCGGTLHRPKIFYKEKNKTKWEHTDDHWFCRKCRQIITLRMIQQ